MKTTRVIVTAVLSVTMACWSDVWGAPPANDDFENRIDLGSLKEVFLTVSSAEATHEMAEPDRLGKPAVSSLWWKWTAASGNQVELPFDDSGQRVAIYEGDSLLSLNPVVPGEWPEIGVTYSIALDVDPESLPDPQMLVLSFRQQHDPLTQTRPHESRVDGIPFSFEVAAPGTTILHWRPPADGLVLVHSNTAQGLWIRREDDPRVVARPVRLNDSTTEGIYYFGGDSQFDYTFEFHYSGQWGLPVPVPAIEASMPEIPSNDRAENAIDLGNLESPQGIGANFRATSDSQEAHFLGTDEPIVWWRWTAPDAGVFAIESSATNFHHSISIAEGLTPATWEPILRVEGIGRVEADSQPVAFTAQEGSVYFIGFSSAICNDEMGDIRFSLSRLPDAPHDLIQQAVDLGAGSSAESSQSLMRASVQVGEPTLERSVLYPRTVWWKWMSREDAFVFLTVRPALAFDGDVFGISVFTTETVDDQGTALNPDWLGRFGFLAEPGKVYLIGLTRGIMATGSNGNIRPQSLGTEVTLFLDTRSASSNDSYDTRTDLGRGREVNVSGHSYFATRDPADPVSSPRTVWWTWTAPYTGLVQVKMTSPPPGVIDGVFVGTGPIQEESVTLSADIRPAEVVLSFGAESGKSYQLCIGTGAEGDVSIAIDLQDDPYTRAISAYAGMDPEDYAPTADPSGDGMSNLLRMAMGIDPRLPLTAGANITRRLTVEKNGDHMVVRCGINPTFATAAGIQFRLEFSLDGREWFRLRAAEVRGDLLELKLAPLELQALRAAYLRARVESLR